MVLEFSQSDIAVRFCWLEMVGVGVTNDAGIGTGLGRGRGTGTGTGTGRDVDDRVIELFLISKLHMCRNDILLVVYSGFVNEVGGGPEPISILYRAVVSVQYVLV